ncbi:MAG: Trk system potassium transporter TrkA [Clostridia bacterium]|nr:Trk system potassium transporter TrkA [Clostridia bacterium]
MKIIIVGCGKVGEAIAGALCNEGHDICVIDTNKQVIEKVTYAYDILGICGDGILYEVLEEAGAAGADLIVATTSRDEINMLSCIIAKDMGTVRCIARVRDPKQNAHAVYLSQHLGISMTVNPELLASREAARLILMPSATEVDTFARGRIDMVQIKLTEDSPICGKPLTKLHNALASKILVCAIQRPGEAEAIIPTGNFVPMAGDKVYVTATHRDMGTFFREMGLQSGKLKNALLIGGGKISYYLAQALQSSGIKVKIIERDHDRCLELASALPKVSIVCGDGADQSVLEEEGIRDFDSVVALTGIDEDNIIVSLYAKLIGVPKIITKINKPELKEMAEKVGIECIISPKQLTTEVMLTYVRSAEKTGSSKIRTLYRVADDKAEAMEFLVDTKCRAVDIPLSELKTKKNLIIAGIIRQGKVIFPGGQDTINQGDIVIVVTTNKFINELDGILE